MVIFNYNYGISEAIKKSEIKKESIVVYDEFGSFVIKFSNLIYEIDGKEVRVPIFRGTMGDVTYNDFLNYCYEKKLLEEGLEETGFIVETKRGELKKTFHEFLNFYKSNILKNADIKKPTKLNLFEEGVLDVYYDFKINGIPMVLQIRISTTADFDDTDPVKSVFDIDKINEKMNTPVPFFKYNIWQNRTTQKMRP